MNRFCMNEAGIRFLPSLITNEQSEFIIDWLLVSSPSFSCQYSWIPGWLRRLLAATCCMWEPRETTIRCTTCSAARGRQRCCSSTPTLLLLLSGSELILETWKYFFWVSKQYCWFSFEWNVFIPHFAQMIPQGGAVSNQRLV